MLNDMTPTQYVNAGYKLSTLTAQAEIDRAETDVKECYITPINSGLTSADTVYNQALMQLSYALLLKRSNVFMTRSGSKKKETPSSSVSADGWENLQNVNTDCHLAIDRLKATSGATATPKIKDIAGIYFKTMFYSM